MKLCDFSLEIPHKKTKKITVNLENLGVYLIQGENGIGKTTLFEQIIFENKNGISFPIEQENDYENNRHNLFSFLPQLQPQISLNVLKYIKSYAPTSNINEIKNLFEIVSLGDEILKKRFNTLSGGEQMKIAFLSSLLRDTPYIFLDEPTNNLDNTSVETIKNLILSYASRKTFIIITHDCRLLNIADSLITIKHEDVRQEIINTTERNVVIPNMEKFTPFKSALKLFSLPHHISLFISSIAMVYIFTFMNNQFLINNYNTGQPPLENVILFSNGMNDIYQLFSYDMFNSRAINEFEIDLINVPRGENITYESIPNIYSIEGVSEIIMSDPVFWEEVNDKIFSEGGLLQSLVIINPPEVFWNGFDILNWMIDPNFLASGRFPKNNLRETTISSSLLQKHFDFTPEDAENAIGKSIILNGIEHEIVGLFYENVAIISNHPEENFGFKHFDMNNFYEFKQQIINFRKQIEWWNPEISYLYLDSIFILTLDGYESDVLRQLLERYPDATYFSSEFSIIYINSQNTRVLNELSRRNLVYTLIFIVISTIPMFDLIKSYKINIEQEELFWLDRKKIKKAYIILCLLSNIPASFIIWVAISFSLDFSKYLIVPSILAFIILNLWKTFITALFNTQIVNDKLKKYNFKVKNNN